MATQATYPLPAVANEHRMPISMFVGPTRLSKGVTLAAFGKTLAQPPASYECIFEMEGIGDENQQTAKAYELENLSPVVTRIVRMKPIEQQLLRQVQSAIALTGFLGGQEQQRHVAAVAELLANAQNDGMVRVSLRTGRSNSDIAHCLSTLRHTVIVVKGLAEGELLVDPNFRANFEIANSPASYTSFLAKHIPSVLVGPVQRFTDLAAVMADVMAFVYIELGMTAPPWRSKKALTSKFAPIAFDELPFPPSTATYTLALSPAQPLAKPFAAPPPPTNDRVRGGKSAKSAVKSLLDMVLQESALPSGKPVGKAAATLAVTGQAPQEREMVETMMHTMAGMLAKGGVPGGHKGEFAVGSPCTVLSVEAS